MKAAKFSGTTKGVKKSNTAPVVTTTTAKAALPQTGAKKTLALSLAGLLLVGVGLLGFGLSKRRE